MDAKEYKKWEKMETAKREKEEVRNNALRSQKKVMVKKSRQNMLLEKITWMTI